MKNTRLCLLLALALTAAAGSTTVRAQASAAVAAADGVRITVVGEITAVDVAARTVSIKGPSGNIGDYAVDRGDLAHHGDAHAVGGTAGDDGLRGGVGRPGVHRRQAGGGGDRQCEDQLLAGGTHDGLLEEKEGRVVEQGGTHRS